MHKGFFRVKAPTLELEEEVPAPCRKRGSRRPVLTVSEKLAIIHQAVVEQLPWKEIAKEHRVSVPTVGILVGKARKKPEFLREISAKEDGKAAKRQAVGVVVEELIKEDAFIDSCESVTELVNSRS